MKLACRLEVLPGNDDLQRIINARDYGFEGIGLPGRQLERHQKSWLELFTDNPPLPAVSLSLGFRGTLLHPQERKRQRCRDSICRLMDTCVRLRVKLLNVPPVLKEDNPERITSADRYDSIEARQDALMLDQLPILGGEARSRGLLLLLEPVNRYESDYLHSIEHGARLCRLAQHPSVGLTIDTFHMQLEEPNYRQAIRNARDQIRHVHLADNTRTEPGSGSLDQTAIFQALKAIDYSGWFEVECRKLSGPGATVFPRSVKFLKELWANA